MRRYAPSGTDGESPPREPLRPAGAESRSSTDATRTYVLLDREDRRPAALDLPGGLGGVRRGAPARLAEPGVGQPRRRRELLPGRLADGRRPGSAPARLPRATSAGARQVVTSLRRASGAAGFTKADFAFVDRLSAALTEPGGQGARPRASQVLDHRAVIGPRCSSATRLLDAARGARPRLGGRHAWAEGPTWPSKSRLAVERIVKEVDAFRPRAPEGLALQGSPARPCRRPRR